MARPALPPGETPIAKLIRRERVARGFEQAQLAERVGASESTVSLWERAKRRPSREHCVRLARVFDLAPEKVLRAAGHAPLSDQEDASAPDPIVKAVQDNDALLAEEKKHLLDTYRLFLAQARRR
jgi:transcriptional regulator with XRE-family HTH domain